jgi:hypothetical protein
MANKKVKFETYIDETTGHTYFYNPITRESVWELPNDAQLYDVSETTEAHGPMSKEENSEVGSLLNFPLLTYAVETWGMGTARTWFERGQVLLLLCEIIITLAAELCSWIAELGN